MPNAPVIYLVILQCDDVHKAKRFYSKLLGVPGQRDWNSVDFDLGPVTLSLLDPSQAAAAGRGPKARPMPDHLLLHVKDTRAVAARARSLKALQCSCGSEPAEYRGELMSFHVEDPFGNKLSFMSTRMYRLARGRSARALADRKVAKKMAANVG
jgi:extradiol dioxygenase family protein